MNGNKLIINKQKIKKKYFKKPKFTAYFLFFSIKKIVFFKTQTFLIYKQKQQNVIRKNLHKTNFGIKKKDKKKQTKNFYKINY